MDHYKSIRGATVVFLMACALVVGCGPKSKWDRIPLAGTATLDGKPFDGSISVLPAPGNRGPSAMTTVSEGEFRFDGSNGPVAGECVAVLMPPAQPGYRLPYRIDQKFEVPAESPFSVQLDFETPKDDEEVKAIQNRATAEQPESAK